MRRRLRAVWLGRRRYDDVHALQLRLCEDRRRGEIGDTVLLLEHEPVVTLGRGAKAGNVLAPPELLRSRGIDLIETGRGGDVTLHAPGQLVAYPIVDLAPDRCDVRRYVGDLTDTMADVVAEHGLSAGRLARFVGLWVDRASPTAWPGEEAAIDASKIGAVGVRISRWITLHGFALNLRTDLELYRFIVPCGISDHGVTSIAALTGSAPPVEEVAERAAEHLARRLDADIVAFDRHAAPLPLDTL